MRIGGDDIFVNIIVVPCIGSVYETGWRWSADPQWTSEPIRFKWHYKPSPNNNRGIAGKFVKVDVIHVAGGFDPLSE